MTNYKDSKANRKQKRCQAIISKETGIESSETPTKFLALCNAGLSTGLQEERLLTETMKTCSILNIVMIPNKSYCFLECESKLDAELLFNSLHGKSNLGQKDSVLYLSYFLDIPKENSLTSKTIIPPGLIILENFIDEIEEENILQSIKTDDNEENQALKHRSVKHFGFEFLYGTNNVDPEKPLERKIPKECDFLWERLKCKDLKMEWECPDQLTVNEYLPGQGIPPHVDTHSAFLGPIVSLSLQSDIVMEFKKGTIKAEILVPKRSLLIMTEESRYDWTHGITPRHIDVVLSKNKTLTTATRSKRTSLTFRRLRKADCSCNFPRLCDSQKKEVEAKSVNLEEVAAKLETENVHKVYDKIASHFSETRHSPWPQVADFLNSFQSSDILLDVGCGNGKYLNVNEELMSIGCDRSVGLLSVCTKNSNSVFQCDCLYLPVRDNSIDGCISIAVIHHLATDERRVQAISEMIRVLRVGGKCLIYVWAKDQKKNFEKSSYLRQNKAVNKNKKSEDDQRDETATSKEIPNVEISLPIHTNRTEFQQQDVYVPWKLKGNQESNQEVFLRYYHVFEENELEKLCKDLKSVEVEKSYYDQGNHCVILKKVY